MDALGDLLDGIRAHTAAFCQTILEPPWALRIADEAPLALVTALDGHAWIVPDDDRPVLLRTGDVAVVKGPDHYTVAGRPDTPPAIVVHAGNRLTATDGSEVTVALEYGMHTNALAPRTGQGRSAGATVLASGTYRVTSDVSERLLAALPVVVRVPCEDARSPIMDLLGVEVGRDEPGQQVVLDRLLDLALIATLRAWFDRPEADPPGWYRAHGDPLVGPALRIIHEDPARPWTVASLAAATGASRAAFARRFTALVAQPPMAYVTHWRLDLAADLLRNSNATVESVARQVGYANAFALTVAFKRVRGITPRQHRDGREGEENAPLASITPRLPVGST
jgi:AraC-like DNA-binding protein